MNELHGLELAVRITEVAAVESTFLPAMRGARMFRRSFEWRCGDLVGMLFGKALVAGVNKDVHLWVGGEEGVDALGADRGGVVDPARREFPPS